MGILRKTIIDENGVVIQTKDYKYTIFDEKKGYLFRNRANRRVSYEDIRLSEVLPSKYEYANMHLLAENMYSDTNMIAVKRNKRWFAADKEDMSKMVKMSIKRFGQFLEKMILAGIVAKVTIRTNDTVQVQYHVNPLYFNASKYLSPALYMMFREQLDRYLPLWVIERFNAVEGKRE